MHYNLIYFHMHSMYLLIAHDTVMYLSNNNDVLILHLQPRFIPKDGKECNPQLRLDMN